MKSFKNILSVGVISTTLVIGFSGCGGMNNPLPSKQVNSTKIEPINIEYKFNDDINNAAISKNNIIQTLTSHMSSNSKYSKIQTKNNPTRDTFGQKVNYQNDTLVISFVNGDKNCHTKECSKEGGSLTKVIFNLPTTITDNLKNNFTVTTNFPINYMIKPHTDAIGLEHSTLDTPINLESDAKSMFQSLKSKPLTINRSMKFKGEVNTEYPAKAVYANFKRMLGEFVNWSYWSSTTKERISESKKQNSFILKINNKSYPLHIEVYPYRNGSKVIYSTTLKYTIDSKGNSTLHAKDISKLHKKIEDIINN